MITCLVNWPLSGQMEAQIDISITSYANLMQITVLQIQCLLVYCLISCYYFGKHDSKWHDVTNGVQN